MKKILAIILIFGILYLVGYFMYDTVLNIPEKKANEKYKELADLKLKESPALFLLFDSLIENNPNKNKNLITQEDFIKKSQIKYDSFLSKNKDPLDKIPFRFQGMKRGTDDAYICIFDYDKYSLLVANTVPKFPNFHLRVSSILSKEQASLLKNNNIYFLSGNLTTLKDKNIIKFENSNLYNTTDIDLGYIYIDSLQFTSF